MRVLGIDPGLTGGLAVYDDEPDFSKGLVDAIDVPTLGEGAKRRVNAIALFEWVRRMEADHAFIERAQAMPDQGASSGFIYGRAVGYLESVVQCARVPLEFIESRAWKHYFGLIKTDKEASRQKAIMRLPAAADLLARKMDHGRAEAGLIALYGLHWIAGGGVKLAPVDKPPAAASEAAQEPPPEAEPLLWDAPPAPVHGMRRRSRGGRG